jgi:hypothetical protein
MLANPEMGPFLKRVWLRVYDVMGTSTLLHSCGSLVLGIAPAVAAAVKKQLDSGTILGPQSHRKWICHERSVNASPPWSWFVLPTAPLKVFT